jgi:hypothetical protein
MLKTVWSVSCLSFLLQLVTLGWTLKYDGKVIENDQSWSKQIKL